MKKTDNGTVKGADGWIVHVPDIHSVEYSEKNRSTVLGIEGGNKGKKVTWYIYKPNPWLWNDENNDGLSNEEKKLVISRIKASFKLLEMPIDKII